MFTTMGVFGLWESSGELASPPGCKEGRQDAQKGDLVMVERSCPRAVEIHENHEVSISMVTY
jgi:hypothetical protein